MAAPTISNTYSATQDSSAQNVSVSVNGSSEFATGDLLLVFVAIDGDQSTSGVSITQSGFTSRWGIQHTGESGDEHWHGCWTKELVSGDTSLTTIQATWSDSNEKASIAVFRIADAEHDGYDVSDSTDGTDAATSAPVSPSVTTTEDDDLVFVSEAHDGGASSTHPSGTTEQVDLLPSGGGPVRMSVATFTQATAGATGTKTWTIGNTKGAIAGTIAIKAAPAGSSFSSRQYYQRFLAG